MKRLPPMSLMARSLMYFSSMPPLSTASVAATKCPMQPPKKMPTGFLAVAKVMVASMDRSPHSARKMSTAKRNTSTTELAEFFAFFNSSLIWHSASPFSSLHSSSAGFETPVSRKDWMPKRSMRKAAATRIRIASPTCKVSFLSITPMLVLTSIITHKANCELRRANILLLRMARIMVRKNVLSPSSLTIIVANASPAPKKTVGVDRPIARLATRFSEEDDWNRGCRWKTYRLGGTTHHALESSTAAKQRELKLETSKTARMQSNSFPNCRRRSFPMSRQPCWTLSGH
mmetsp:Transcript_101392/g.180258  ORF Transcript_101392/g.180258 Transcript_101392/m.180258 type:complete len:288 (+) Transcript_101392:71-934(+)